MRERRGEREGERERDEGRRERARGLEMPLKEEKKRDCAALRADTIFMGRSLTERDNLIPCSKCPPPPLSLSFSLALLDVLLTLPPPSIPGFSGYEMEDGERRGGERKGT